MSAGALARRRRSPGAEYASIRLLHACSRLQHLAAAPHAASYWAAIGAFRQLTANGCTEGFALGFAYGMRMTLRKDLRLALQINKYMNKEIYIYIYVYTYKIKKLYIYDAFNLYLKEEATFFWYQNQKPLFVIWEMK